MTELPPVSAGGSGVTDVPTRKIKAWRREDAGAVAADDGTFVHTWAGDSKRSRDEWKHGVWTAEEDALLMRAYDEYCDAHGLAGDERLKPIVERSTGGHACWKAVASRFKHRSLLSIYERAIRIMHPGNYRGEWDDDELRVLLALVAEHGHNWRKIGLLMNRLPDIAMQKYLRIRRREVQNEGAWSAAEEAALLAAVRELGTRTAEGGYVGIPWGAVAARLSTRTHAQCREKWYGGGHGERALGLVWGDAADAALVAAVAADGGETREEVYWDRLLPGRAATDCRRRFDALVKRVPQHAHRPFAECVDALAREAAAAAAEAARAVGDALAPARRRVAARLWRDHKPPAAVATSDDVGAHVTKETAPSFPDAAGVEPSNVGCDTIGTTSGAPGFAHSASGDVSLANLHAAVTGAFKKRKHKHNRKLATLTAVDAGALDASVSK